MFRFMLSLLFCILFSSSVFADSVCDNTFGTLVCSSGTVSQLPSGHYGAVTLSGTTVSGAVKNITAGAFVAENANLQGKVNFTAGQATLTSSTVLGAIDVMAGQDTFTKTSFSKSVSLHSQEVVLDATTLSDDLEIYFSDSGKNASLKLKKGSVISGNVTFVGNPGKICLQSGSSIKGKVINGKIGC